MLNNSLFGNSYLTELSVPSTSLFTNQSKKYQYSKSMLDNKDISILGENSIIYQPNNIYEMEIYSLFGEHLSDLISEAFITGDKFQEILSNSINNIKEYNHFCTSLSFLKNELETWSLINSLYRDRVINLETEHKCPDLPHGIHLSEKRLTNYLFENDAVVRQAQMIVDWLECGARLVLENRDMPFTFSRNRMTTCENTLHLLKQDKQLGKVTKNIVTQLDPDASNRQKKKLCDLDLEDEHQLLEYVLVCIRAGLLDKGREACIAAGQMWRAITLKGWKLYHDANMENSKPNGQLQKTEGNKHRILWKKMAWSLVESPRYALEEKAVYAVLSGNSEYALAYFKASWHDRLWAHLRLFVEQRVEANLHSKFVPLARQSSLPEHYFNKSLTFEQIFSEMESCSSEIVKEESSYRLNIVQKFIILGDISSLIDYMHSWCVDFSKKPIPHFHRFLAHLVLYLRAINLINVQYEKCTVILRTYVELLIDLKLNHLVAAYVYHLPPTIQVQLYATFLKEVSDSSTRLESLNTARQHDIDVALVTKLIVENLIRDIEFNVSDDIDIACEISEMDARLINGIEWLLFDQLQREEAMRQVNTIFRYLLAANKLSASFKLLKTFPSDSIPVILSSNCCELTTKLPAQLQNHIKEFICYKTYLESIEAYEDWFDHFQNRKPVSPESANLGSTSFAEKVAAEQRLKQYDTKMSRWTATANTKAQMAIDQLNTVLLFPEGGWITDLFADLSEPRSLQMSGLRRECLPRTAFRLHRVLHGSGRPKEAVGLGDVIADEQLQLYQVFSTENLEKMMELICESSKQLVEEKFDTLGYPILIHKKAN